MYSAGKEALEREQEEKRTAEDKARTESEDQKAKEQIEKVIAELSKYKDLPLDHVYLINSQYVSDIAKAVSATVEGYTTALGLLQNQLEKAKSTSELAFKDATFELNKAVEVANSDVAEMKDAIFQILKVLTRNADAELDMIHTIKLELTQS